MHHNAGVSNWKCRYCTKQFNKPIKQFKHYILIHEKGTFACNFCNYTSDLRIDIFHHRCNDKNSKMQIENAKLNDQQFAVMKINSINCLHCSNKFNSTINLTVHWRKVHRFKLFPCYVENCKMSFPKIYKLNNHLKRFHNLSHCPICTKPLSRMFQKDLRKHMTFYHQEGEFQCIQCQHQPTMRTKAAFKEHCETEHFNSDFNQRLSCPIDQCKAVLNAKENLIQHLQDTHGISEFMCFYRNCRCSFSSENQLEDHVAQTHTVKSWKCPYCIVGRIPTHRGLRFHINQDHFGGIFLNTDFTQHVAQLDNFSHPILNYFSDNNYSADFLNHSSMPYNEMWSEKPFYPSQ